MCWMEDWRERFGMGFNVMIGMSGKATELEFRDNIPYRNVFYGFCLGGWDR